MITATINNIQVQAEEGKTVLQVATENGIDIPTLCYHEGLPAYGACRMCLVEITMRERTKLESACTRPLEEGMVIRTNTEGIGKHRKMIAELLLARCPESEEIRKIADEIGVTENRFGKLDQDCILCGLCVRACHDAIGTGAINFVNRGMNRLVDTPFSINSDMCIGCGACANICPTGTIEIEDRGDKRYVKYFNTELELQACKDCGKYFTTKRYLSRNEEKFDQTDDLRLICPECRRKHQGINLKKHMVLTQY